MVFDEMSMDVQKFVQAIGKLFKMCRRLDESVLKVKMKRK